METHHEFTHTPMDVKLWLKVHKINKAGKAPISARITIAGKRTERTTKIRVFPEDWDQATEKVIVRADGQGLSDKTVKILNEDLELQVAKLKLLKTRIDFDGLSVKDMRKALQPKKPRPSVDLLAALDIVLETHYKKANQGTYNNFCRVRDLVREWATETKQKTVDRDQFTEDVPQQLITWLLTQVGVPSVRNSIIALTAMWRRAGVLKVAPFDGIKLPKYQRKRKTSLTKEQFTRLRDADGLTDWALHARNIYVACFYLHGSRISAVLQLRWRDYDGQRIQYQAMKNGPFKSVVVSPHLRAVLDFYRPATPNPAALIFPLLQAGFHQLSAAEQLRERHRTVSAINRGLAQACKALGLPEHIHPHTARHTMARMTYEKTKDLRGAQHVLGHTDPRTTLIYIREMLTEEIDTAAAAVYDNL